MTDRDEAIRARCEAAEAIKLPCNVTLGRTTVHKGCNLSTLLLVIQNRNAFELERDSRLKALMEDNEKLKDECTDWLDDNARMSNEIERLESALAEAQRRAEAAEADLNHIAQQMFDDSSEEMRGDWYPCEVCQKPGVLPDGDCVDCLAASYVEPRECAFKWRGPDGREEKQ